MIRACFPLDHVTDKDIIFIYTDNALPLLEPKASPQSISRLRSLALDYWERSQKHGVILVIGIQLHGSLQYLAL